MKNRHPSSPCPNMDCRADGVPLQFPAAERLRDAGVTDGWIGSAHECSYCGCVYTWRDSTKTIKGWLRGARWVGEVAN